jgi:hypothetical protein
MLEAHPWAYGILAVAPAGTIYRVLYPSGKN